MDAPLSTSKVVAVQSQPQVSTIPTFRLGSVPPRTAAEISVCSFNIQFLGNSSTRENEFLAEMLAKACDVVFIQELLAAPMPVRPGPSEGGLALAGPGGRSVQYRPALNQDERAQLMKSGGVHAGVIWQTFPNGDEVKFSEKTTPFFQGMTSRGFSFVLSQDKTSRRENHSNNAESEWFIAFFDPARLQPVYPEYTTFLKDHPDELVGGGDYIRVPHGFGFRTVDGKLDFVAVSVHLHFTFKAAVLTELRAAYNTDEMGGRAKYAHLFAPSLADSGRRPSVPELDSRQRAHELRMIRRWIRERLGAPPHRERDFIILGDMNISNKVELARMLDAMKSDADDPGMRSFNEGCEHTNASYQPEKKTTQQCYDQIFFDEDHLSEANLEAGFSVFDLTRILPGVRDEQGQMIMSGTEFRTKYSDHFPVMIKLRIPEKDDD